MDMVFEAFNWLVRLPLWAQITCVTALLYAQVYHFDLVVEKEVNKRLAALLKAGAKGQQQGKYQSY